MKVDGDAATADSIPEGYEIYEHPGNSQVFLRKIPKKIIEDKEKKLIEESIKKYSDIELFIVDIKKDSIVIYMPNQDVNTISGILNSYSRLPRSTNKGLESIINYAPEMQFSLLDKNKRTFIAERFCYRGSVDDWIYIGKPDSLDALVEEYIKHLGKDSFFELY